MKMGNDKQRRREREEYVVVGGSGRDSWSQLTDY